MNLTEQERIHMQWDSTIYTCGSARQPPELMHYGIKGQKWGLRRFQEENGSYTAAGRERYRKSAGSSGRTGGLKKGKTRGADTEKEEARRRQNGKDRKDWKAKDVNDLSDEELRRRNNRLQAEQNYKNSVTPQWKKDAKQWGKEAVKALLVTTTLAIITESFKETLKPVVKNKMQDIYDKASKKSISSVNSEKHKTASYLASMFKKKRAGERSTEKG